MLPSLQVLHRFKSGQTYRRSYSNVSSSEVPQARMYCSICSFKSIDMLFNIDRYALNWEMEELTILTMFHVFLSLDLKARFDYKAIREQAEQIKQNVLNRNAGGIVNVDKVVELYELWSEKKRICDIMRSRRNEIASILSKAKNRDQNLIAEGKKLKEDITVIEEETNNLETELSSEAFKLPNWTHPDSPKLGQPPAILSMFGSKPTFDGYTPHSHMELGKMDDMLHFPTSFGASKFYYGKRDAALLETALVNWAMTTVANKYGFTALTTPDVIAIPFAEACGFQPRSAATQMYSISESELCLVGTQEIPIAALYTESMIPEDQLPIKMIAYGHCFRHETGSSSESRGLYRVHQFTKVEMFIICKPSDSEKYHKELLDIETSLLSDLNLHYKVLDMPSDDLGASAYRKFDIEAWMPYKEDFGEVTSASNCLDYQSRRLNMRYRPSETKNGALAPPQFVHTLNATAIAIPRITLAIMENFQQADRSIRLPDVLVPFMGGRKFINEPKKNQPL
jgi:seryl-tRNA synthetase